MAALTNTGTISYNDVTFGVHTKTHVQIRPVSDRARRVTTALEYRFDVSSYILAADMGDTSAEMTVNIRRALTQKGGNLVYSNWGFGDLNINAAGGAVRDITYGPHPELIDCTHFGPNNAWLIRWTCTTTIPDQCANPNRSPNRPVFYNFEWDVSKDEHGYTVRTITGIAEIPTGQVAGVAKVDNVADNLWFNIYSQIPIPDGFQRRDQRHLDDSKRQLTFTIVDTEKPRNGFVAGFTEWSGQQDVSTSLAEGGFVEYVNNLSATYRLARDKPKSLAMQHFQQLIKSRVDHKAAKFRTALIPLSFRVSDKLNTDEVSFSFSWMLTVPSKAQALAASGLWEPIPNGKWEDWRKSVGNTAAHPQGNAKLYFDPNSDAIISLCSAAAVPSVAPGAAPKDTGTPTPTVTITDSDEFYAFYECWLTHTGTNNIVFHHALGDAPPTGYQFTEEAVGYKIPLSQGVIPKDVVQSVGAGTCYFYLTGRAIRAEHPITAPTLLSVGGQKTYLVRPWFSQKKQARFGKSIYAAQWNHLYRTAGTPGGSDMPVPPNPLLDGKGPIGIGSPGAQ